MEHTPRAPKNPRVASLRGRRAKAIRDGNLAVAEAALVELVATKAEDYITELVNAAPPLTHAQRTRLASLLMHGPSPDNDARRPKGARAA